ncbi:MAG: hypothetical protein K6G11_08990 [Lachnospiraceae bacterium]|nr:hypothetical protein [Lachnospiraceae bacterium]
MSKITEVQVEETVSKEDVKKRFNVCMKKLNELVKKNQTEKNNQ